jgi:hypothetical protein
MARRLPIRARDGAATHPAPTDTQQDQEVILLDTSAMGSPEGGDLDGVRRASTPVEAVEPAPKRQPGRAASGLSGRGAPAIVLAAL